MAASRHTHRHRDGLLQLPVTHDLHLVRRVIDGGHQLLGNGETRLGAAGVDVDDRAGRPEVLRPPADLGVAGPVEPAGYRRDRRDVDRLLGHRPVGDRPREVDVDRLGGSDLGAVRRVECRRREHRLTDVGRRVLAGRRALGDHGGLSGGRRRRERVRRRNANGAAEAAARAGSTGGGGASGSAGGGGANGSGGGAGAAAGSIGAGGGGSSGSASADGFPSASPPTSPAAIIAVTSLPLIRFRITHLQFANFVQSGTAKTTGYRLEGAA